ncbi:hypothetical protein [Desulfitobacterium sp.]|nr:hypothetical protein [Desulfitobacterium sp.]HVJ49693.1 hypothetical protein [Desulfitobacterium sp.]
MNTPKTVLSMSLKMCVSSFLAGEWNIYYAQEAKRLEKAERKGFAARNT